MCAHGLAYGAYITVGIIERQNNFLQGKSLFRENIYNTDRTRTKVVEILLSHQKGTD